MERRPNYKQRSQSFALNSSGDHNICVTCIWNLKLSSALFVPDTQSIVSGDGMLSCMRGVDETTITVLSGKVVIGGLTLSDAGGWIWALFAVRETDVHAANDSKSAKFYGSAENENDALSALKARWQQWLDDAELVCTAPVDPRILNS